MPLIAIAQNLSRKLLLLFVLSYFFIFFIPITFDWPLAKPETLNSRMALQYSLELEKNGSFIASIIHLSLSANI